MSTCTSPSLDTCENVRVGVGMCSHIWTRRLLKAHTDLDIWTINVLSKCGFLATKAHRAGDLQTNTHRHSLTFQANREKADRHVLSQEGSSLLMNPKIFGLSEPEGLEEEWLQGVYLFIATTFVKAIGGSQERALVMFLKGLPWSSPPPGTLGGRAPPSSSIY